MCQPLGIRPGPQTPLSSSNAVTAIMGANGVPSDSIRGSAPGPPLGISQQANPQTQWRIEAIVSPKTVWAIFFTNQCPRPP